MRSDLSADMAVKRRLPEPTKSSSAEITSNVERGFPVFVIAEASRRKIWASGRAGLGGSERGEERWPARMLRSCGARVEARHPVRVPRSVRVRVV